MKSLLVFAHKGEASSFIRELQLTRDNSFSGELYLSKKLSLLICGEGPMRASTKLSKAIHHLKPEQIQSVINMGIAGSLSEKLKTDQIYDFSVILGEASFAKPEFKSFESTHSQSKYYLITALDRVKTDPYSKQLSQFAEAVDREAWGLAFVCDEYSLPFSCIKLISDKAGPDTQCFDVREKAKIYADQLFQYYIEKQKDLKNSDSLGNKKGCFNQEILNKDFYFSTTQKNQFEKLSSSLQKSNEKLFQDILSDRNLEEICQEYQRPKERTKVLLEEFQNNLNPFQKGFSSKLKEWFSGRPHSVKQIQTDPFFEKEDIKILLEIKTNEDLTLAQDYLSKLPLDKYHDLFNGLSEDQDV